MEKWLYNNILKIAIVISLPLLLAFCAQKVYGSDENGDRLCLAQNIYFEAGNQPLAGKIAVANVTLNRVEDLQFPETICDVVYQSKAYYESWTGNKVPVRGMCQFSWYCDGKSDEPKDSRTWVESIRIADMVLNEKTIDITDGALWYHADYVYPYWADHLTKVITIENHIFYK